MREISHDRLVARGLIEPVAFGGADERLWIDCDLASLAEHRLGDATDPHALTPERRALWETRATLESPWKLEDRARYESCYWLIEGGERVGTIALSHMTYGGGDARLASLYVFPSRRGQGVGQRALARIGEALADGGFGYRLDTYWTWQRTVRFYLYRVGLWLYMWKRSLTFYWQREHPRPLFEFEGGVARLAVMQGDARVVLATAQMRGDRLEFHGPSPEQLEDPALASVAWNADTTLALALALEGWALVRSPEAWEKHRYGDAGAPEALAHKIAWWEAFDREHGWRVETPHIPGLEYPTWAELQDD
jgi:GNAT superfamily N-acetyltransferase